MAGWGGSHICLSSKHILVCPKRTIRPQVLANYLALRGERYCAGRTILELGSGTGLVGLVAGKLGGKVWITDQVSVSTPNVSWFVMHD